MLIKDLQSGKVREYGSDQHDSLAISQDGRVLTYYNLQNGDGSRWGDYRFVMEDGEVPEKSETPDALYAECYFNIGGFDSAEEAYKQGKADATRWVPVSERLPEENEHVLVCMRGGFITTSVYLENSFVGVTVIAWMHLPEPYREEKEE